MEPAASRCGHLPSRMSSPQCSPKGYRAADADGVYRKAAADIGEFRTALCRGVQTASHLSCVLPRRDCRACGIAFVPAQRLALTLPNHLRTEGTAALVSL